MARPVPQHRKKKPAAKPVPGVPQLTPETFTSTERIGRDVFGLDFYEHQIRVMREVDKPRSRVCWVACHGAGKTLIGSLGSVSFPLMHAEGICRDTATTFKQVRSQTWKEIHRLLSKARKRHPGLGWPEPQRTHWFPNEDERAFRHCVGVTAEDEGAFQGEHGKMLFLVNEAQAVEDFIFNAIENNRAAGEISEFRIGNATTTEGAFHAGFHGERHLWVPIVTTAFDTPNLAGVTEADLMRMSDRELDDNPWPTITRRWVRERLETWGPDDPRYRVKVMAEFPVVDAYGYVALEWLERAVEDLPEKAYRDEPLIAAVDPAGPGKDETACYAMRGGQVVSSMFTVEEDARGPVVKWLRDLGGPEAVACVPYDPVGLGHYMGKHIKDHGYKVRPVHPQEPAKQPKQYHRRKDEMAFELRDALESPMKGRGQQIGGLTDEKTRGQLLGMRWGVRPDGTTAMETKADREARGLSSPDRAEALFMAKTAGGRERIRVFGAGGINQPVSADSSERDREDAWRPPLVDMLSKRGKW